MSRRDIHVTLRQMRDHGREALEMVRGRSRSDLDSDRMRALALVRLLEVVGEAAVRVPAEDRARFSGIPWPQIIGLRNRLIHGYDEVDLDIVWQILSAELPGLVNELNRLLESKT
jgi:uncharacterized protein with HEPN domain